MELVPFVYRDVRLKESCWIDRKPYFTARAIGEWLEAKHPVKYVHNIVERNPHILQFSKEVDLVITQRTGKEHVPQFEVCDNGNDRGKHIRQIDVRANVYNREIKVRVYDPIGLQLIVMESNLPKAIAYKIAVAHLVWAYMNGKLKRSKTVERKHLPKPVCPLTGFPVWSKERKEAIFRLAREKGLSKSTIYEHAQKLMNGEPIYKGRNRHQIYIEKNYDRLYEIYKLRYERNLKLREISERLGLSMQTICRWAKYFKNGQSL